MNQQVKQWLDMAEMDYNSAEHLFKNCYPMMHEIICYHCQQAAEKSVKAILVLHNPQVRVPKSHDLDLLLYEVKDKIAFDKKFFEYSLIMSPYAIFILLSWSRNGNE